MSAEEPVRRGYGLAMLARHLSLCFTRMRRVVRDMEDVGAGWGAFTAISLLAGLALFPETVARDPGLIRRTLDGAAVGESSAAYAVLMLGWPVALALPVALFLAVAWWGTCRLFRAEVTLRQSVIGVAAGSLPQIVLSLLLAALALALAALLGAERQYDLLGWLDYAVILALWGYGLVAYSAATGLSPAQTFAVQIIGVVAGALIVLGVAALAAPLFDMSLSRLIQLVLG